MAEWMPTHKYVVLPSSQELRTTPLLEQCEDMTRSGRLQEAFRLFAKAFEQEKVEKHQLKTLVEALVKFQMNKMEQEICQKSSKENSVDETIKDMLSCSMCEALFTEPITLPCGHTFCKFCLEDDITKESCKICGMPDTEETKATTFLLNDLIFKWFPRKFELGLEKTKGRNCLLQHKYDQAIEIFSLVLSEEPMDINCLSWRAECYFYLGMLELALKDIGIACNIFPNSIRFLLRKSKILSKMGDRENKFLTLLQCAALAPHNSGILEELQSELYELFRLETSIKESVLSLNFLTVERKGVSLFSNDRELSQTDNDVIMRDCNLDDNRENTSPTNSDKDKIKLETSLEKWEFIPSSCKEEPMSELFSCTPCTTTLDKSQDSGRESLLEDFECKLCCSLLYKPVTSPCGHIFCRDCLRRSLDYRLECPCCRNVLGKYLAERRENVTVVLERIIRKLFANECDMWDKNYEQEMLAMKRSVEASEFEIPIFICTLAFPSVPCPLHIFEPQYKLMIRRCIESGSKQFGMCASTEDSTFPTTGTILRIGEVAYLPDGRSLVNTTGTRRFQILSHYTKDGYNIAKVKWLVDEVEDDEEEVQEIKQLHLNVYKMLEFWFNCLTTKQRDCIVDAIGNMPKQEELDSSKNDQPLWLWWALAALPLQDKPKLIILAMTSVVERLRSIARFLKLMIDMQRRVAKKE